jgi:hypothetical protein
VGGVDGAQRAGQLVGEPAGGREKGPEVGTGLVDEVGPVVGLVLRPEDPVALVEQADVVGGVARGVQDA